jgi:phosphatidylinositol glycan class O
MAEGLKSFRKKFIAAEEMYERYIEHHYYPTSTNMKDNNDDDNDNNDNDNNSDAQAYEVFLAYAHFLRASLSFCRRIWAQFDTVLMSIGITILLAICLCMWRITRRTTSLPKTTVISWYKGALAGTVIMILAQRIRLALVIFNMLDLHTLHDLDQIIVAMVTGFMISFLVNSYYEPIIFDYTELIDITIDSIWHRLSALLPSIDEGFGWIVVFGAQCMMFASNSLTVFEDRIDLALLQTYGIVSIVRAIARYRTCYLHSKQQQQQQQQDANEDNHQLMAAWRRWIISACLFMLLTRLSGSTTICRDEQGKNCIPNFYTGSGAWASDATLIQLVASAIITPWLIQRVFINTQSFHGVARLWIEWGLRLALLLSAGYWILEESYSIPKTTDDPDTPNVVIVDDTGLYGGSSAMSQSEEEAIDVVKRVVAQFGFGSSLIIGLIGWRSNPLCLAVGKLNQSTNTNNTNNSTPSIRTILGIDNAYGAPYLVLVTIIYAALSQTQQPSGSLSFAMGICHLITAIELFSAQSTVLRMTQPKLQSTSALGQAVILTLMAQHYYFATGHQATLASIQWRVGFIGLKEVNWVLSPLLIIANTFASHILFSMAIPLVVLWRLSARKSISNPTRASSMIWTRVCRITFAWSLVWTILVAAICIWCVNFRRHLMVWKVWAPRFMLGAVATLLNQLMLVVATLFFGVARTVDVVDKTLNNH